MKYLLDSNVCISFLRGRLPLLYKTFTAIPASEKAVCSPVKAELYYGAYRSQQIQKNIAQLNGFLSAFLSLPFDDVASQICAELRAELAAKGMLIGPYDLQIAAIALAHNLTLVTHNTSEFSRITKLTIEDWEI